MHLVEIAFGHHDRHGKMLAIEQITTAETHGLFTFAQLFRGGQAQRHTGSYLNDDGICVIEPCSIIRAYAKNAQQHSRSLCTLAREIGESLNQDSVLVAIACLSGAIYFIRPTPAFLPAEIARLEEQLETASAVLVGQNSRL